jgi:hypothetical protein
MAKRPFYASRHIPPRGPVSISSVIHLSIHTSCHPDDSYLEQLHLAFGRVDLAPAPLEGWPALVVNDTRSRD